MKFLIWFVGIFICALIQTILRSMGIYLGAIPTMILFGATFWAARTLCRKWDEKKGNGNEAD